MPFYQDGTTFYEQNPDGGFYPIGSAPVDTYPALPTSGGFSSPPPGGDVLGDSTDSPSDNGGSPLGSGNTNDSGSVPTEFNGVMYNSESDAAAAKQQYDTEWGALSNQFDYNQEGLEAQLGYLNNAQTIDESNLQGALEGAQSSVSTAKEESQNYADTEIGEAGDIARQTQRSNRNVLRSLGILASSAAGELLSRPMNAFDKQRAKVMTSLTLRKKQLDDYLVEKTNEHANLMATLKNKYAQMKDQIQRDLRFNATSRIDSMKQLNAAMEKHMQELRLAQMQLQNQVGTQIANIGQQWEQMNAGYKDPSFDQSGIRASDISTPVADGRPKQAQIYQPEEKKKDFLSGLSMPIGGGTGVKTSDYGNYQGSMGF